jgi:hypothetical protein
MRTLLTVTAALALSAVAAPQARAVDLTGTWDGTLNCNAFDGRKLTAKFSSTMKILQTGPTAIMSLDDQDFYVGGTIDDDVKPDKKGEALFVACHTQAAPTDFGEIVRGQVATLGNGTLTYKAASIFQGDGFDVFGSCRWTFKRTDPTPPDVPVCP